MTRRIHRNGFHLTYLIDIAVFEQRIKLAAVALEFGTFVENFSKGFLNGHNLFTDTDLPAQSVLNIGSR